MFRKPRETSSPSIEIPLNPSVGRPPTPPNGDQIANPQASSMMASRTSSTKPLTPRPNSKSNVPSSSRQNTSTKKTTTGFAKTPGKPNGNILNFFKKVEDPLKEDSIFLSDNSRESAERPRTPSHGTLPYEIADSVADDDDGLFGRFNEVAGPMKKRKTSNEGVTSDTGDIGSPKATHALSSGCTPPPSDEKTKPKPKKRRRTGPFLSDSDTDEEPDNQNFQGSTVMAGKQELDHVVADQPDNLNDWVEAKPIEQGDIKENKSIIPTIESTKADDQMPPKQRKRVPVAEAQAKWEALQPKSREYSDQENEDNSPTPANDALPSLPLLKKEETSIDEWGKFDDIDEFPDDEFADGEEFIERKWMEEQARLEAAEDQERLEGGFNDFPDNDVGMGGSDESMTTACPICDTSLCGVTPDEATRHVNGCLDGNPIPSPQPVLETIKPEPSEVKFMPPEAKNRFARKAAIARPGQANPFQLGNQDSAPSSAFSKLMSGHAEDAAWANAAAAEQAARGKPAYQRTCPFYKIMPGFFICVDAFRYGAVQGCKAYFLSHFHSDHYVGLTSSWCHGPIYCSKVTANLVKQQLRVDPKWVVPLDFEERFDVPGTEGVAVTMIPANHCPGSSLFLYEKTIGRGRNPKIQRVLHCGDFRACPAHVAHPLLMPDIVDSITGNTKQQKIDVCYLDTTYLNPRYAFPSQEDVITACADMCVSLRKERAEESDAWEVVKRERAGTGMTKFVSNASIKGEDDSIAMSLSSNNAAPRGRLLVVCGTYSIGKERICMGIARALDCKIWAPPGKMRICAALEDPELMSRMTDDPKKAQIHMQMLMEIRPETLQEYLNSYKPHFSRVVGFRPSGWNYKPPNSRYMLYPALVPFLPSSPYSN
jgi:DNA cross-link repair 1A protein